MSPSTSPLDEIKIIAYGQTTERFSTGNVSAISAKAIAQTPVSDPILALQGRVPGIFIQQGSGVPGSTIKVRIQGQSSLSSGSDPFYIVDGVPYNSILPTGLGGILSGALNGSQFGSGSPFEFLNPAEIESVSVLKGADATSIYGSRAAAGAILITTKKGKAGQTKVDFNIQNGWGKVGHFVDLLNLQQYLAVRHEAFRNDGKTPGLTDYDINGTWDTTRTTNWQKTLLGGTAQYNDEQVSVSGGSVNTTFLAGIGYHRETTVFPGDYNNQRYSMRLNLNHASTDQRFRIQMNIGYVQDNNHPLTTDLTALALTLPPDAPSLFNPDGSQNWAPNASGSSTWQNPLYATNANYQNKTSNLVSSSVVSYELFSGLNVSVNAGYDRTFVNELFLIPQGYVAPESRASFSRAARFGTNDFNSWNIEPQLNYHKIIGKGKLEVLIGSTLQQKEFEQREVFASGFTNDQQMQDLRSATTLTAGTTGTSTYRYNALFGRLNYIWDEKYILNVSARRDGSSRFGAADQFNNFASVGAAWIFTEEKFLKNEISFLSYGKLKGSYGSTGNDQIGDYQFLNLYSSQAYPVPYQGGSGLTTRTLPNPYLQWELVKKIDAGLDLGFFKDRIVFNATWYRNRSSNQLQGYSLPAIAGIGTITENFPATIENSGWEFNLSTLNIKQNDFNWRTNINLTLQSNKLVEYQNLAQSSFANAYIIGQPFTNTRLFQAVGVDPNTGLYIFTKSDGTKTSTPVSPQDYLTAKNTQPKLYGGFQNSFSYKQFSFDFLVNFVDQIATDYRFGNSPGSFASYNFALVWGNQPTTVLNRWQKIGDNSQIQKFSTSYTGVAATSQLRELQSNAAYVNASYARLKNAAFSWALPKQWVNKAGIQNARLYIQGQNLFTLTSYIGLDPETQSQYTLPPLRIWTLGAQITL